MLAYRIGEIQIKDKKSNSEYAKRGGLTIEKHCSHFLSRGAKCKTLESRKYPQNILVGFLFF